MVPFADMINHKIPETANWGYDEERRGFVVTAKQDIGFGEELYYSYGIKDPMDFFVDYGFSFYPI